MSNTNCLENRCCPRCGQMERFRITATSIFELTDEGTEGHEDVEYDEHATVTCSACDWFGEFGQLFKEYT